MTRQHHTIDAATLPLGRLASRAAVLLRGKHRATYAPNVDRGDFVHVVNVGALRFAARKLTGKRYHRFTGYPGGVRTVTLAERCEVDPSGVVRDAVYGMLPRNRLRDRMIKRLSIVR